MTLDTLLGSPHLCPGGCWATDVKDERQLSNDKGPTPRRDSPDRGGFRAARESVPQTSEWPRHDLKPARGPWPQDPLQDDDEGPGLRPPGPGRRDGLRFATEGAVGTLVCRARSPEAGLWRLQLASCTRVGGPGALGGLCSPQLGPSSPLLQPGRHWYCCEALRGHWGGQKGPHVPAVATPNTSPQTRRQHTWAPSCPHADHHVS